MTHLSLKTELDAKSYIFFIFSGQVLYQLGARKFFVNNVSPLGCQPLNINKVKPKTPCVEEVNMRISTYNKLLPGLVADLESSLPESKFILVDLFKLLEDVYASPSSYGEFITLHNLPKL